MEIEKNLNAWPGLRPRVRLFLLMVCAMMLPVAVQSVRAQANLPLYTDNLVNGFLNYSWATVNFRATAAVHGGSNSISVVTSANSALYLSHPAFSSAPYSSVSFWINGGATGGQKVAVWGLLDGVNQTPYAITTLSPNTWRQVIVPLSSLLVSNKANFTGILIQGNTSASQPAFYVDDVSLLATPAPATVHLGLDAGKALRTVDARHFGVNTATWDTNFTNPQSLTLLQELGCQTLRWPGGSTGNLYHWAADPAGNAAFMHYATNIGAQVFITANYGTGTPAEAAAWVRFANVTNHCGFKYWEIGNENYGGWETDSNAVPYDPYTYATNVATFMQLMKAADPTIKIGVVGWPGEDGYVNNYNHPAVNPRTGATHNGWTPVMLTTLKNLGVTPDFLIDHYYPQYTPPNWAPNSPEGDAFILQVTGNPAPTALTDWASIAANLRQQLTDYLGPASTNTELCMTEINSDPGILGRQSTSIVNALYVVESTSQLMKTEFNSFVWWDFHDHTQSGGVFDPTLYGWRTNGDYGMLSENNYRYPTFYAVKFLQYFARGGDTLLNVSSDYLWLSAYAARIKNGALTLMVLNKDSVTNLTAQITLTNFFPWSTATMRSYGIAQDEAARTNAPAAAQDIATNTFAVAGTNFTATFPPYTMTLFTFAPAAPRLLTLPAPNGQFSFQLQGQSGVTYQIQTSTNFIAWTSNATVTLTNATWSFTNSIASGAKFWRAVWLP
jgi:hypothetical protein